MGVSIEHSMMRFFLSIVLAGVALADSEPYTIGQVAHGYGHGIITGVDYGHGLVSGCGAIGNRGYYGGYAGYGSIHHGFYGKREADSDSDAYTIGQVATGHAYGIVTGVDYGHGLVSGYGAIGNRGYGGFYGGYRGYYGKRDVDSDAYTIGQVALGLPVANAYATGHPHNVGVITRVGYSGYGGYARYGGYHHGFYGKREADSDAYTIGQVAYGLPVANAYATGHPHNVGVITGVGYSGYGGYAGYGGYHHGFYGKREADSDAYTIGQVAYGLPVANAYATGHPHNVGV